MDRLRAIIVEDERMPRLSLAEKLAVYHPSVEVVDMCEDCDAALESILRLRPDVLFLDIELPEKNSLWLLGKLREVSTLPMPHIIFTTAFSDSEYLMQAIKLQAADYLLKPVSLDELAAAIRKVQQKYSAATGQLSTGNPRRFSFKIMHAVLSVAPEDFVYAQADGCYSKLVTAAGIEEIVFERLGEIEQQAAGGMIVRAGRKYMVNTAYIYKLDSRFSVCRLRLPSGVIVNLSLSEGGMDTLINAVSAASATD